MQNSKIRLIKCNRRIIENILLGDQALSKELNITVPKKWSEFGEDIFLFALESLKSNPNSSKWWAYLPILKESNTLIGSCGFKGEPTEGMVEIGYEVAENYRNNGYATEIVQLLVNIAFESNQVQTIVAHTLAEENASVHILRKKGFKFIKEQEDPEDGLIWQWNLENSTKIHTNYNA